MAVSKRAEGRAREDRASLEAQLRFLESGGSQVGADKGSDLEDATAEAMDEVKRRIAICDEIIEGRKGEAGGTVGPRQRLRVPPAVRRRHRDVGVLEPSIGARTAATS